MTQAKQNFSKQQYQIQIHASAEKVWHSTFDLESYQQWTSAFAADSTVETDWQEGSEAIFSDGKGNGMVGRIAKSEPFYFLSIEHIGIIKDGEKIFEGENIDCWVGAHENYTFEENDGKTLLTIDMDINESYVDMFNEMWPNALARLKEIAEA